MNTAVLAPRQTAKSPGMSAPVTMKKYLAAKQVWDALDTNAKKQLLHQHGRDHFLASRSYPYLPKEVRQDIQLTLLKEKSAKQPLQPAKRYWWQEA